MTVLISPITEKNQQDLSTAFYKLWQSFSRHHPNHMASRVWAEMAMMHGIQRMIMDGGLTENQAMEIARQLHQRSLHALQSVKAGN